MLKENFYSLAFCLVISLTSLLGGCTSKGNTDVPTSAPVSSEDSTSTWNELEEEYEETPPENTRNIIWYTSATDDEIRKNLETFTPFVPVNTLASQSIHLKDSLELLHEDQALVPEDSLIFGPTENAAYQAILDYKKQMATGAPLEGNCPSLLELTRTPDATDSSFQVLPPAKPSTLFSHGKFFFVGGAPFIYQLQPEDNNMFTDPQGKPEVRFATSLTENSGYLLRSVYHFKNGPLDIQYGPPLDSYDMGPQEVRKIGSLIHRFVQRVPVLFITEAGLVPGHLTAVTLKLVDENLGCISDAPLIEFVCSKNISHNDILAVYIPYQSPSPSASIIKRISENLWTADLNNDGVIDLACVSESWIGEASGNTLAECLWYINIDGAWKIIDYGSDLDCT